MERHRSSRLRRALTVVPLAVLLVVPMIVGSGPSVAAPSKAELDRARDRLMELERDFELVVEHYNLVHERLDDLRALIASRQLEVDRLSARMRTKEQAAVDLATELYKGGSAQAVEAILSSESLTEIDTGLVYLERSEKAQTQVFETLDAEKDQLAIELKDLEKKKDQAAEEEERLNALREEVESKVEAQKDEVYRLNQLIERAERRAARAARAAARRANQALPSFSLEIKPAPAPNKAAGIAVDAALAQVGKPYQWGAAGPSSFDCSGLTMYAWAQAGVGLPHNSGAQYGATTRVAQSDWQPGDLLFFGSPIHHVAMYIGNGQMVEAPYSGEYVRVVSASRSDYVGAGRPGV